MLDELGYNFKLIQSDWPYKTRPNSAQKKNTGNGFYKVKRQSIKRGRAAKKVAPAAKCTAKKTIGSDNAKSRRWLAGLERAFQLQCNVRAALVVSLCISCSCRWLWWLLAMQLEECNAGVTVQVLSVWQAGRWEEEEELLALSRCCTARCSGPRNVKVCRRRKERDSPDLTRYHSALSQEVRSSCWTSSTFVQMLFTDLTPLL